MTEALRTALFSALVVAGLVSARPCLAGDVSADAALTDLPVPPIPAPDEVEEAAHRLANPLNIPITGATIAPRIGGGEVPPSLESLQAARPDVKPSEGLSGPRAEALREAALSYGARGGLAARAFAINEMLRRYETRLDRSFDFHNLVGTAAGGQTLMRPPVVTEAELAFALADGGQTARETGHIYQITRQAQLASAPPNWRTYLVRTWATPRRPRMRCDRGPRMRSLTGTNGSPKAGQRASAKRWKSSCPTCHGSSGI